MKKLSQVKEVSTIDQFFAVMDFLNAMGYDTNGLTVLEAAGIKHDLVEAIEGFEDLLPGRVNWEEYKIEEGDLPL
mgnify:CR=1 FL=1|jgi:hypothetical protein